MAFKDKVKKYIVGNENKEPFHESNLPATRTKQFFDILKNRLGAIVGISLLVFAFSLLAIVWFIAWRAFIISPPADIANDPVLLANRAFYLNLILYLVLLPLIMLSYVGLGGAFQVLKKLCWNEGIFFFHDFAKGIRESYKVSLLAGFLVGFVLLGTMSNYYFYQVISLPFIMQVAFMTILTLILVITIMASLFMVMQAQIFRNKISGYLKNGYLFAAVLFPKNLVFFILGIIPLIVFFFIRLIFLQLVYLFVLAIIGFGIFTLIWSLYSIYVFDKYINQNYEKELVDKGLYHHQKGE